MTTETKNNSIVEKKNDLSERNRLWAYTNFFDSFLLTPIHLASPISLRLSKAWSELQEQSNKKEIIKAINDKNKTTILRKEQTSLILV